MRKHFIFISSSIHQFLAQAYTSLEKHEYIEKEIDRFDSLADLSFFLSKEESRVSLRVSKEARPDFQNTDKYLPDVAL